VALEGLAERGLSENQEYLDRLEEELQIIKDIKFAP
jgi:DNA polymerase III alpha subunit